MRILYDHQIFNEQVFGGISRYFYEIIREFELDKDIDISSSIVLSNNHYIENSNFIKARPFFPRTSFAGKMMIQSSINKIYAINKLKKGDFDIFHPTYYDPYFIKYLGKKPFIITVHDMIHEKFKDMFHYKDKITERKKYLVKKAAKIIVVSENTKEDLINIFNIDESKIEVVYHGNSMLPPLKNKMLEDTPEKFILFIGTREVYKNFITFIRAITPLLNNDKNLSVVCVGGGKFKKKELALFKSLKINKSLYQYSLNDEKLGQFYRNALLFVFPSLYEGFGLPILESFACECPVACSNNSSMPEIAGDAAFYFDPNSEESILAAIESLLTNEKLRINLLEKARERLKLFTWGEAAKKTKSIYESIL
ncbi:MAG: glycosyltransferase family 1 protein [bacterium]|nr:glycosyltransferase family 1 protein [bacterium]